MKPWNREKLTKLLIVFSVIASTSYVIIRISLFLAADYKAIEKVFAVLLLTADLFIIVHGIGYAMHLIKTHAPKERKFPLMEEMPVGRNPSVAIIVAARHEPKDVLSSTFAALRGIDYANKRIYFLDDSSDEKYKREAKELSKEFDLILFTRPERHGAKAGVINDCLKNMTEDYLAIFDADQIPLPEFLNHIIPIMEKDKKLAFVQTPQFYSNIDENRIARAAGFQQAVFYEYICEGKSSDGAMFCCGTNVVMRRKALVDVGGFDETTVTEDFATSIKFHQRGWKSLYYNHVYVFGMGPEDLTAYFKQQFRWATGTISVFKKVVWQMIIHPFSLKPAQWWEYILSCSYYFIGTVFLIYMICPVAYILFKIPSFFANPEIYFMSFLPYLVLSLSAFYFILAKRFYKPKDLFMGQVLSSMAFSVYTGATLTSLLGLKTKFEVTGKSKGSAISYLKLWPQMSMLFLNFIAFTWAINRFMYEHNPAILMNGIWTFYYFLILCGIFYFNDTTTSEITCNIVPPMLKFEYKAIGERHDYAPFTWKTCTRMFLPEELKPGEAVMFKIYPQSETEPLIFEANVVASSARKTRHGFNTELGVTLISGADRKRLERIMEKQ
jgi:cellulose synthase (UDP-forming)